MVSAAWAAGDPPQFSVIVSTRDRGPLLSDLVAALEGQAYPADRFEVVILDDGSTDESWPVLRTLVAATPLRLLVVRSDENQGAARGRNAAVAFTRASLLAFTDDDCLPTAAWLAALASAFGSGPGADVVQGRTLPHEASRPAAGPWARSVWVTAPSGLFETCNIAYRRAVFDAAGGFPERPVAGHRHGHGRPFGEDALLGDRVVRRGGRFVFAADALVHHRYEPGGYGDWLRDRRRAARFPALARQSPSFRAQLRAGVFLSPATAATAVAAAGALAALMTGRRLPLVGAVPWLALRRGEARHRAAGRPFVVRYPQLALGDALTLASLVEGSVRHRRLVV